MAKTDYNTVIQASQDNIRLLREKLDDLDNLHKDILSLKNDTGELPVKFNKWYADFVKINDDYRQVLSEANEKYVEVSNEMFTSTLKVFNESSQNTLGRLDAENKKIETSLVSFSKVKDDFSDEVLRLTSVDIEEYFAKHNKALSDISGSINLVNNAIGGMVSNVQNNHQAISATQNKIELSKEIVLGELKQRTDGIVGQIKSVSDRISTIETLVGENDTVLGKKLNILIVLVAIGVLITVAMKFI